ncbi:MAG: DUF1887 family protein [Balneolales bacterium]|nr:DUF1887 family protein [Balneolales bacterium]
MQTMICLVSDDSDIELNYEASLEINPHSIVLCYTSTAQNEVKQLQKRLSAALNSDISLVKVPEFDLDAIQDIAENLFMSLHGKQIVLHYSGGTKPMSIGFFEEFRGTGCSIVHTDLNTRTMWWRTAEGFFQKKMQ